MKGKKTLPLSLIVMLVVSMAMLGVSVTFGVGAITGDSISVVPPSVTFESDIPNFYLGTEFTVLVNVTDVVDYYGADFWLWYNGTLLNVTAVTVDGPGQVAPTVSAQRSISVSWGPESGGSAFESDALKFSCTFVYGEGAPTFTGNGTVAWITFEILYAPPQLIKPPDYNEVNSTLSFDLTGWTVWYYAPTLPTVPTAEDFDVLEDGFYSYKTLSLTPGAPIADFTWTPTYPFPSDTVTLTDTSDPGPEPAYIVSWKWTIISGNATLTGPDNESTTTMLCIGPGSVFVNLNVTNDPFGLSDDVTLEIEQVEKPTAFIDVFTIKSWLGNTTLYRERGTGIANPGSAFVIGETVTLRAYAEFAGYPVAAVNVAFQTNLTFLVATTNIVGNATVSFRLPYSEAFFGTHQVTTTARIFETDAIDTLDFNVGWILEVTSVTVEPATVAREETVSFTVNVKNIDPWDAYPAVITISVFDSMDVPLGTNATAVLVDPGTGAYTLTVTIPTYAQPGVGAYVRANAFTDYPALGGSAYCPEVTEYFEITL